MTETDSTVLETLLEQLDAREKVRIAAELFTDAVRTSKDGTTIASLFMGGLHEDDTDVLKQLIWEAQNMIENHESRNEEADEE